MLLKRILIPGGVTLSLALAFGFFLRNGNALATRFGTAQAVEIDAATAVQQTSAENSKIQVVRKISRTGLPRPPAAALVPGPLYVDKISLAGRLSGSEPENWSTGLEDLARSPFGIACNFTVSAKLESAARVALTISAPCHGEEPLVVRHGDLTVTELTSLDGRARIVLPALAERAEFTVSLANGTRRTVAVSVPDASDYDQVILQWVGETGLEIHALEFGADYGEAGHVWRRAPRSPVAAAAARGGFLTTLGATELASGHRAMVYSFPTSSIFRKGIVRLNVEAEVTEDNCGQDLTAQTLQKTGTTGVRVTELTLSVSGCDTIGDILLLKNLLQDLKIAQN